MGDLQNPDSVSYLSKREAAEIDEILMGPLGFSVDQLMELAGLSVATLIAEVYILNEYPRVLTICGPGNNGGDGLVAARHLHHFGYKTSVCYPKRTPNILYTGLVTQLESLPIPFLSVDDLHLDLSNDFDILVDAMFGFSFHGKGCIRMGLKQRKIAVESKLFDLQKIILKEGVYLKVTEKGWKGGLSNIWVPEEVIVWLKKVLGACLEEKQGIIIPKGPRSSGWRSFHKAVAFFIQKSNPEVRRFPLGPQNQNHVRVGSCVNPGGKWRVGSLANRISQRQGGRDSLQTESMVGLRCHAEKLGGESRIVVDRDVGNFNRWSEAVVCSIGGLDQADDWEGETKIISQCLEEKNIILFPFDEHWAIFHSSTPRPPFDELIQRLVRLQSLDQKRQKSPVIVSVDVPSGWHVEEGDNGGEGIKPDMLVSLTAPKLCAKKFCGPHHFLGGRFVPPSIADKYKLYLPPYPGTSMFVRIGKPPPTDIATLRKNFISPEFHEEDVEADPMDQFHKWFDDAVAAGLREPNAMALSTANMDGKPSLRMVLLKGVNKEGFVWCSNYESRKAFEISENPRASLLFYWDSLSRQVRVEGAVQKVSDEESEEYFHSRPRESQISAIVSKQRTIVPRRHVLHQEYKELEAKFSDGLQYSLKEIDGRHLWTIERLAP
ncbi:hypothetical protein HHK36_009564 [Tetracentron sinense]|uniref:NAD(P)H-hydrate epimerase n=1 Tax=Tetracentron sinense TaxID=13715 RepID=A0A834ZJ65_TETSI|nr:hypothetical protein HHK36_009564 [Tetracentron sinense]